MGKSTRERTSRKAPGKPKKPYLGFPLTPHPNGSWVKKIRGKLHYFGKWAKRVDGVLTRIDGDGCKEAEEAYNAVRDDLHAGRTPRVKAGGLTVAELCARFLQAKQRKIEAGELSTTMFRDYRVITDLLVSFFGANRLVDDLAADDFARLRETMVKRWGPVRLGNSIARTKTVFKFGLDNGLIDRVIRYGSEFVKPDKSVLRKHRAKMPARMFEAVELRAMIDGMLVVGDTGPELVRPGPALRAMILLGVNCGFGNTDCASLTLDALDLAAGWIDFPRPKTGVARRCPLWPETVAAIRAAVEVRPTPADLPDCNRVFLAPRGNPFVVHTAKGNRKDLIGDWFTKLLRPMGMYRKGVGFYTLRHVFETIAGGSKDQVAVDMVMGHSDPSMASVYRERIEDARLKAVSEHVRKWVFVENPVAKSEA
jgi:integrase